MILLSIQNRFNSLSINKFDQVEIEFLFLIIINYPIIAIISTIKLLITISRIMLCKKFKNSIAVKENKSEKNY